MVLNWNASGLTARCVSSLLATDYPPDRMDIVVVDNGSIDGSVARLRRQFPDVTLTENGANLGFAEGCNRALRELDGLDAVALINNDATVDPGWLWPLVERIGTDPTIGAVAPKLLLADTFVTVELRQLDHDVPRAVVESVSVDGSDVTHRVLGRSGVTPVPHPTIPLRVSYEIAELGELAVPISSFPAEVAVEVRADGAVEVVGRNPAPDMNRDGNRTTLTWREHGPGHRRLNSLGLSLTPWSEGLELGFGEVDSASDLVSQEVPGWSGGAVLLRREYLAECGLFDPRFFAYYEDTDLAWRGRRAGWRTVTEPRSVVHHLHGASAGSTWRGFFFLNYRNWLLTVLRNGSFADLRASAKVAWRLAWGPTRRNVVGPLRRLQRVDGTITRRWLGVGGGVVAALAPTAASRRHRDRVGVEQHAPDSFTLKMLGDLSPRAPRVHPSGPLVVYIDVTETLRSGWRAGIQRVVTRLVDELLRDPALDLVPVIWSDLDRAWRRLDNDEMERLLDPPPMENHPRPPPDRASVLRRIIGPWTRRGPAARVKESVRRRRMLRSRPAHLSSLVLERFEPGSVFFDPDASWNVVDAPRSAVLDRLTDDGVRAVAFAHDVLPLTHPMWFERHLVDVFEQHVVAHLRHHSTFICNSQHTADELRTVAARHSLPSPTAVVVGLGSDPGAPPTEGGALRRELSAAVAERPTLLVVGTIEPRKNHELLLDALDVLWGEGCDVGLIVVGRLGWRAEAVGQRLREHPELGARLQWPSSVDDRELTDLYRRARAVVVPSTTEGYGLPVVEALAQGAVVVSSSGGALAEVGGDAVLRFSPDRPDELLARLRTVIFDDDRWADLRARAAEFDVPSWEACAERVADVLQAPATSGSSAVEAATVE